MLHRHVGVAVVTTWTEYQRPSKRIGPGCGVHKIFQQAWVALAKGLKRQDVELNVELCGLGVDLAAGPLDEDADKDIKVARLKKADALFSRDSAFSDKFLVVFTVQVLNPCVRSFFEDSKGEQDMFNASYQGQLFSLSNLEHSTPMAAIDALKQTLAPKSTH